MYENLKEEVYVKQPLGFVKKRQEYKVYRCKMALYGLKQATRAWYSCIKSYFDSHGFIKYPFEHTLFAKYGDGGKILIVYLYVDDLVYTDNDVDMIHEFNIL